jgi:hypothetical protein
MNRYIIVDSPGATVPVLARLFLVQTWTPDRPTVPPVDRQFIWRYCLPLSRFCQSSDAIRIWTVGSSDNACWLEASRSVPTTPMLAPMVPSVHPTVSIPCFLASLTCFFASLILVASMGPRYVYKDMVDNVVSLIACVSMNHQNQLEQMANGYMFSTILHYSIVV